MDHLSGALAAAVGVFAGTNVDDLVVLTVLFLSSWAVGRPARWQIRVGQYAGIALLVAASALAALGLSIVPDRWVGLLGLIPVGLGVRVLVRALHAHAAGGDTAPTMASGLVSVAGVTIANGADNIAVYTPLFRTIGQSSSLLTVAVFALLVAVWCLARSWLGSHRRVIDVLRRYGRWLVPIVFIVIGAVILIRSGATHPWR